MHENVDTRIPGEPDNIIHDSNCALARASDRVFHRINHGQGAKAKVSAGSIFARSQVSKLDIPVVCFLGLV